jgi:DNA repair and recombination protein RAD52
MFTDAQKKMLEAPLLAKNVRPPAPGRFGDYIEGWHAIAEANRIFGHGQWDRKTAVNLLEVPVLKEGKYYVHYSGHSIITVRNNEGVEATRHGWGFGSGIDKDVGRAHESAIKEAETDAMKRALMTFGNPFGLALYDKTQEHVAQFDEARIVEFEEGIEAATDNDQLEKLLLEYGGDTTLLFEADRERWGELSKKMAARKKEFKS